MGGQGGRRGNSTSGEKSKGKEETEKAKGGGDDRKAPCLKCTRVVGRDDEGMLCHDCNRWAHRKCVDISLKQYEFLTEASDSIQWVCDGCLIDKGERRVLERKIDQLSSLIQTLGEKVVMMEKSFTGEGIEDKIEKMVTKKVDEAMEEREEREKRKFNLVVVNLPESRKTEANERKNEEVNQLKEMVKEICPELGEVDIEDPVRMGRLGGNKPRLLKFKVQNDEVKEKVLRNSYKLNRGVEKQEDRVYINPDFTPAERLKQKELRDELKRRRDEGETDLVIRGGKIIKRAAKPEARAAAPKE